MIRIILSGFILCIVINSYSQSLKNDLKITVAAIPLIDVNNQFKSGIKGIVFKPSIGYFINNRTSLELNFSYVSYDKLVIDGIDSHYDSYGFIPVIRYAFINKEKLRLFAELGFGYGTIKYNPDNQQYKPPVFEQLSGGISLFNLGVGLNYYFNPKFGVELIIPYIRSRNITSDYTDVLYNGIGPTIGLTFKVN
ncbi:MAG: outer membrane beta-barrel protein [Bacteroidetes bacterium]|nr:outer membrane beta-barrel protein [Bacteroidota bacterium]